MAEIDNYGNGQQQLVSVEKPAGGVGWSDQEGVERDIQDGWPVGEDGLPDLDGTLGGPGIAQVELVGELFYREIDGANVRLGDDDLHVLAASVVRIVAGYGPDGDLVYEQASDVPFHPSDLPHVRLKDGEQQDIADQGFNSPSLSNTRKEGASSRYPAGKIK